LFGGGVIRRFPSTIRIRLAQGQRHNPATPTLLRLGLVPFVGQEMTDAGEQERAKAAALLIGLLGCCLPYLSGCFLRIRQCCNDCGFHTQSRIESS
jgi:hypothetical protein